MFASLLALTLGKLINMNSTAVFYVSHCKILVHSLISFYPAGLCCCSKASSKSVMFLECVLVRLQSLHAVLKLIIPCVEYWCIGSLFLSGQSFLGQPRLYGPSEALVQDVVELNCELLIYPNNETILLQLFK